MTHRWRQQPEFLERELLLVDCPVRAALAAPTYLVESSWAIAARLRETRKSWAVVEQLGQLF